MTAEGADNRIIGTPGPFQPARVLRTLAIGCAVATILGSAPLLVWAQSLPDSPLQPAAQAWQSAMSGIGTAKLYESLRAVVRKVETQQF